MRGERNPAGTNEQAILYGDPSKPGPYVARIKWLPGNMSRPHYPEAAVPVPAGSYVIHYANKVHATATPAEKRTP